MALLRRGGEVQTKPHTAAPIPFLRVQTHNIFTFLRDGMDTVGMIGPPVGSVNRTFR